MDNKPSKLALGVALFAVGVILLSKSQEVKEVDTSDTFENEPVSIEGFDANDYQSMPTPNRILIPSLGVDLEVGRARIINGYWEVFEEKAGWGEGSGFPGQPGNQVIFAHAREGLFSPLQSIEVGEKIYIFTDTKWYRYEVVQKKDVNPSQIEVIAPTDEEILTLYTCSGYKDEKRLILIARPI